MRRLFCILLCVIITIIPVYATDTEPESTEPPETTAYVPDAEETDDGLADMFGTLSANQQSFLDNWDAIMSGDPTNEWNQLAFEVPSTVDSIASLNLQFTNLQDQMALQGFGADMQLQIPEFQQGYSFSITDAFAQTFGDVGHLTMEAKLPSGWNMASIMATAKTARDAARAEFESSALYTTVKSDISFGSVLDGLNVDAYTQSHKDDLSTTLAPLSNSNLKAWNCYSQLFLTQFNNEKAEAFEALTISDSDYSYNDIIDKQEEQHEVMQEFQEYAEADYNRQNIFDHFSASNLGAQDLCLYYYFREKGIEGVWSEDNTTRGTNISNWLSDSENIEMLENDSNASGSIGTYAKCVLALLEKHHLS